MILAGWSSRAHFVVPLEFEIKGQRMVDSSTHDFFVNFVAYDYECGPLHGRVSGNFGYNQLLDIDIQAVNFDHPAKINARLILPRRPFPWSRTNSIGVELERYFENVHGEKNPDGISVFDAPSRSK